MHPQQAAIMAEKAIALIERSNQPFVTELICSEEQLNQRAIARAKRFEELQNGFPEYIDDAYEVTEQIH